jgi:excisionase family DNA binding protein
MTDLPQGDGVPAQGGLLTLQEAAAVVGCHYMTLYRKVRAGEVPALLAGGRYRIRPADLEEWLSQRPARGGATASPVERRNWGMHATTFLDALMNGTGEHARSLIERLVANGADPVDVCDRVLAPALHAIGERWAAGTVSIAHEHRATATVQGIVAAIAPAFAVPGPRRGTAVVATVVRSRHTTGSSMVAGALRADRFTVHYLGGDLPTVDLVDLAAAEAADVVALSCPPLSSLTAVHAAVAALDAVEIPVILGGAGIDAETATSFGAFGYGQSLREAQKLARSAVADRRRREA